jgi:hypothetical protein
MTVKYNICVLRNKYFVYNMSRGTYFRCFVALQWFEVGEP